MKKKLAALMLAGSMVLGLLSACGQSDSTTSAAETSSPASTAATTTTSAATPAPAASVDESAAETAASAEDSAAAIADVPDTVLPLTTDDVTYTVWMGISPSAMNYIKTLAENRTYQEIMKRTGINLEFQHFHPDAQTEQFNLICASGEYPDIMNGVADQYTGGADAGIEEGMFLDLKDYMEEYAPHYWARINSDKALYDSVTTTGDRIAGFYSLYNEARLNDMGYVIRQDWLDSLNMDKPTTYDQLHDVLTAFKEQKGSTDALFIPATGVTDYFLAGYGVGSGFYLDGDTIKYGPMEDGFKTYLQMMNQWYSEGLIYSDFPFYGEQLAFRDNGLIGSGAVSVYYSETGDMASAASFSDDPNFLLSAMAPVSEEEGGKVYMSDTAPSKADALRWSITTDCADPELAIQMIDYFYSDEGSLLCNYGIEGETFNYDANGTPQFSDLIYNNPDGLDYRTALFLNVMDAGPFVVDPMRGTKGYTAEQLSSWDDWVSNNMDYSHVIPTKAKLNQEEQEEYDKLYSDIDTFLDEMTVKYITGEKSFDTYDTDFVGKLKDMSAERCTELYQEAYDRYVQG